MIALEMALVYAVVISDLADDTAAVYATVRLLTALSIREAWSALISMRSASMAVFISVAILPFKRVSNAAMSVFICSIEALIPDISVWVCSCWVSVEKVAFAQSFVDASSVST